MSTKSGTKDLFVLATGAGLSLFGKFAGRALLFVSHIIVARVLGPRDFGLYALGWTVLRLSSLVAGLGLDRGVLRFGTEARHQSEGALGSVLRRCLWMSAISGLLLATALFSSSGTLADIVFHKPGLSFIFRSFAVALPLAVLLRVLASATIISKRMQYAVYAEDLIQPSVQLMALAVLIPLGFRLGGALVAAGVSFAVAMVVAWYFLQRLFGAQMRTANQSWVGSRELLGYSLMTSLGTIFGVLILRIDRLVVGYFLPAEQLGVYEAASQIAGLLPLVSGAFGAIFAPLITECYYRGERRRLEELYRVSTKWGLFLVLPSLIFICYNSRYLISAVFDARYESGWIPLLVLAVGQSMNAVTGAVGVLLMMTGRQKRWLGIAGGVLFMDLLLNILLVPRLGLLGAAASTSLANAALFGLGLAQVRISLRIWPYDLRFIKIPIAAGAAVVGLIVLRQVNFGSGLLELATAATISFGPFVLALLVLFPDAEEKHLLRALRARMARESRQENAGN